MTPEQLRSKGQNIRLIVCDLDGTLLGPERRVSDANLQALAAARQKGIVVTICSGRIHSMLGLYARLLGIDGPVIAANGAVIYHAVTGQLLYGHPIPQNLLAPFLAVLAQHGYDYITFSSGLCCHAPASARIGHVAEYNRMAAEAGLPEVLYRPVDDGFAGPLSQEVYKVLVHHPAGNFAPLLAHFAAHPGFSHTSSGHHLLDVAAAGVNKGEGVRRLTALLGLEQSQVCVFGDYLNDLSMFEAAGLSFAMGNALPQVQRAASAVTAANTQNGVAQAIARYIL